MIQSQRKSNPPHNPSSQLPYHIKLKIKNKTKTKKQKNKKNKKQKGKKKEKEKTENLIKRSQTQKEEIKMYLQPSSSTAIATVPNRAHELGSHI